MSRPATRSKNKKRKSDNAEDNLSEILRKIHTSSEISESDVIQLYHISRPVCEGCRVNSKDSPNCFCGLVPASNGTRKSGLWQKMSEIVSSLGPDPCKDFRTSTETPAGLTNLGATCYANSILQCLYMNTSFRIRILSVEMELFNRQPVLKQLARLFAQLHSCKMAFVDSAPFIKTLELDNGVQQDSHEFLTLFLSLLERSLSHSKVPKARNVVQDLFRGGVSHVTRCSECGKHSESSSKMEDFYELELNIKGLTNLHESLEDYLSVEELNGENQYFCESCAKRVDATRNIKLRSLPSVLNFQLKRYVFLPKTTTKKKITTIFSFPRQLNMGKSLSDCAESTYVYDLSAILIHKGSAANSGHYVAHIKDENTGQWWEFDDEHVAKLGTHPFGEEPSKSSAKSGHSMEKNGPEQVGSTSNGLSSTANSKTSNGEETFSSSDAYMLMYCRKNDIDSTNMVHDIRSSDVSVDSSLPFHLSEEIQQLNASYTKACEEYQLKKNGNLSHVSKRREEVKSVLSVAPVHSLEGPYFWISTDWLRHWSDNVNTPCMDNSTIQCLHGKVPFTKIHSMKRVSSVAWTRLFSEYGGGPTLTNEDWCSECIKDIAKNATFVDDYRDKRASLKELAAAAVAGKTSDPNQYYVSRAWLNQWIRRKNADPPCESNVGPTASLRCPHNGLLPEQAAGAKRVLVPEALWLFLYESDDAVKHDDSFGFQAFPADTKACEFCSSELMEVASQEDTLRTAKLIQRQNHEKLFLGKGFALFPGHKYFLVSSSWLANWRSYVTTTGKNVASSMELDMLEASIDSLICEKHSQLLERPPELVRKRGMITQEPNIEGLTLIPEDDWRVFCEEWDVTEGKGISAEILLPNDVPSNQPGSCEEMPIAVVDSKATSDEANGDMEFEKLIIRTCPEICEVCIGERESCELMQKLNYSNAEISVFLVSGKEAPKSLLQASGSIAKLDRRYSKRSRKTTRGNSVKFRVACSTTIYQLKMMIWESFGVVKENQKLHKGSVEIEGDSATLADKNIFPEDVLWVRDTEIHENRDIADELSEQKTEFRQTEEGFRGSLLTKVASDQVLE